MEILVVGASPTMTSVRRFKCLGFAIDCQYVTIADLMRREMAPFCPTVISP